MPPGAQQDYRVFKTEGTLETVAVVTNDKWMKEKGGQLDINDVAVLDEASQHGKCKVKIMNVSEMLDHLEKVDPKKMQALKQDFEVKTGIIYTKEQFQILADKANDRLREFRGITSEMTLGQATQIRFWRVDCRMTWRCVARSAYREAFLIAWEPPSNQLMGMALCERAAKFFGEGFMEDPWN